MLRTRVGRRCGLDGGRAGAGRAKYAMESCNLDLWLRGAFLDATDAKRPCAVDTERTQVFRALRSTIAFDLALLSTTPGDRSTLGAASSDRSRTRRRRSRRWFECRHTSGVTLNHPRPSCRRHGARRSNSSRMRRRRSRPSTLAGEGSIYTEIQSLISSHAPPRARGKAATGRRADQRHAVGRFNANGLLGTLLANHPTEG